MQSLIRRHADPIYSDLQLLRDRLLAVHTHTHTQINNSLSVCSCVKTLFYSRCQCFSTELSVVITHSGGAWRSSSWPSAPCWPGSSGWCGWRTVPACRVLHPPAWGWTCRWWASLLYTDGAVHHDRPPAVWPGHKLQINTWHSRVLDGAHLHCSWWAMGVWVLTSDVMVNPITSMQPSSWRCGSKSWCSLGWPHGIVPAQYLQHTLITSLCVLPDFGVFYTVFTSCLGVLPVLVYLGMLRKSRHCNFISWTLAVRSVPSHWERGNRIHVKSADWDPPPPVWLAWSVDLLADKSSCNCRRTFSTFRLILQLLVSSLWLILLTC